MVSQKMDIKKIIAIGLLLVSFAMLFLPWVNMSVKVKGTSYSLYDLCQVGGASKAEIEKELHEEAQDTAETIEAFLDIEINADSLEKVYMIFFKGKASVAQLAWASSLMKSYEEEMVKYADENDEDIDDDTVQRVSTLRTVSVALWSGLVLAAVTLCYGIHAIRKEKKWGVWLYAIVISALFLALTSTIGKLNGITAKSVSDVMDVAFNSVYWMCGYDKLGDVKDILNDATDNFELFHVEIGAYICLIAALGVAVFRILQMKNVRWAVQPGRGNWPCGCGAINRSESRFCVRCGRARVQNRCSCGAQLQPGAFFCNVCGARVGGGGSYTPPIPPVRAEPEYVPPVRAEPEHVPPVRPDPPKDPEPFRNMGDL